MKLCFIADTSSVHARRWIKYFSDRHEVHVIGTGPIAGDWGNAHLYPLVTESHSSTLARPNDQASVARFRHALHGLEKYPLIASLRRYRWAAARLGQTVRWRTRVRDRIARIAPDLLHAVRIPPEGFLGALSGFHPLVVSSWGNDLTFWARAFPGFGHLTRLTLTRADGYIPDCQRDSRLALRFGWDPAKPTLVNLGSSVDLDFFHPDPGDTFYRKQQSIPTHAHVILSYRGFGLFYNPLTIVRAVPAVLQSFPEAVFILVGDLNSIPGRAVCDEVARLDLENSVRLVNRVPDADIPRLLHIADVMISVSSVDGTPITLLEAMACGVPPVVSDLDSIREWVTDGENGFLVNPQDPATVSQAVLSLLANPSRREAIRKHNLRVVRERGDYRRNMRAVERWVQDLAKVARPSEGVHSEHSTQ
jgi:glycosyltransferase involved in cell wall biosynthesis